jgi:energy-coupling factor transport system permease protein
MSEFEFMRSMPFTEFSPRNTWLQRIEPRAFLLSFFIFLVSILLVTNISTLLAILTVIIIGMIISQVPIRVFMRGFLSALPFILIIAAINIFFNTAVDSGTTYLKWRSIHISSADFRVAIILILRFTAMMLLISLVSSTLSTSRFIHGMERIFSPLKYLKIPVLEFIIAVEISIRFIPILTLTAERIAKAQASRGAVWGSGSGSLFARVKQVAPLLVPLFVQSLHKAEALAMAMDARGFGVIPERTSYIRSKFTWMDASYLAGCLLLAVGILAFA